MEPVRQDRAQRNNPNRNKYLPNDDAQTSACKGGEGNKSNAADCGQTE